MNPAHGAKEKLGAVAGTIATLELTQINLWIAVIAGTLTILCLIPTAITNWKKFLAKPADSPNEKNAAND